MSQTAKSWNIIVSQEKIQKFIHNTRSSFEPIDLNGMTDIYLLLTGVLGKKIIYDLPNIPIPEDQLEKIKQI